MEDLTEEESDLLDKVGICKTCLQPFEHEINEPFAHCRCGTSEWTFTDITKEPLLIQLQFRKASA